MSISFLGTGLMGQPLAERLLAAQIPVTAYNRTRTKLEPLQAHGATLADTPAQAIQASDCTMLMLTDAPAIAQVLFNPESQAALPGKTVIQMSTIAPQESQEIRDRVVAAGGEYLEAPVLGSTPEAKAGQLIVMVGSTDTQFSQWSPLLQNFGPNPLHVGEVGTAAALKLAMNQLIASLTTAFSVSLGLVQRYGLDPERFMEVVRHSALYAPTFDKKLQRMLDRNFENPNFPTKHMLKDTKLVISAAESVGLQANSLVGVQQILEQAVDLGLADSDYSALYAAVNPPQ